MKVRSRHNGQVTVVDADYNEGQRPKAFFNQIIAARNDIPQGAHCRFFVRMASDNKLLKIDSVEKLALAVSSKNDKKPLIVVIRSVGKHAATSATGHAADSKATSGGISAMSTEVNVRSKVQGDIKVLKVKYQDGSDPASFISTILSGRGDSPAAPGNLALFTRSPDAENKVKITTAGELQSAIASLKPGKPFLAVLRPNKKVNGPRKDNPPKPQAKKLRVKSRYQGDVKVVEAIYNMTKEPNALFRQIVAGRGDVTQKPKDCWFLVERPSDRKLERVESLEMLSSSVTSKQPGKPLLVVIRPKKAGANNGANKENAVSSPGNQVVVRTKYNGDEKSIEIPFDNSSSFDGFFRQILMARGDVQHGIKKNELFMRQKQSNCAEQIDSIEKVQSAFAQSGQSPLIIIRPKKDTLSHKNKNSAVSQRAVQTIKITVRSRYQGKLEVVEVNYNPEAPPRAFFKQVLQARNDIKSGMQQKKFLVKNSIDNKPSEIDSPAGLHAMVTSCQMKKGVVVVIRDCTKQQGGKQNKAEYQTVELPIILKVNGEKQPKTVLKTGNSLALFKKSLKGMGPVPANPKMFARLYSGDQQLLKLDSNKALTRAMAELPTSKPMRLVIRGSDKQ